MKKLLAFLLAIALFLTGTLALGAAEETINLTIMTTATGGDLATFFDGINDLYAAAHPGTNIVLHHEAMSFNDLQGAPLQVRFASGTAPDILLLTVEMSLTLVQAGYLYPLDAYYTDAVKADYYDGIVDGVSTFNGHQYTFMIHRGLETIFYDAKALTEKNIAVPATFEDLLQAITAANSDDAYGFTAYVDPTDHLIMTFMPLIWARGGDALNVEKTSGALDTPQVIAGLKDIRALMETGAMDPMPTVGGNDVSLIGNGETVFQFSTFGNCRTLANNFPERLADIEVMRYPMPAGCDFVTYGGGWAMAVSAQSAAAQAAADVAAWLALDSIDVVKAMCLSGGNMPCRRSVLEQDAELAAMYTSNKLYNTLISDAQMLDSIRMAYVAPSEFNQVLIDMIERALYEMETPIEQIAKEQNEKMNAFLSAYTGPRDGMLRQSFQFKN